MRDGFLIGSATLVLAACAGGGSSVAIAPVGVGVVSAANALTWVNRTRSEGPRPDSITFNWRATAPDGAGSGRGAVQIAKPDSLRLDVACLLGACRYTAFVLGDTAVWAVPKDKVEKFVPSYPLLWALIGQALPPVTNAKVLGLESESSTWWQYLSGSDTVTYVLKHSTPRQLTVNVVTAGKQVGRVTTTFDASGKLVQSVLLLPRGTGKLELTFKKAVRPDSIARDQWRAPSDSL